MILSGRVRALILAGVLAVPLAAPASGATDVRVIELTQTACQFLESEGGVDHGFTTTSKADCEAINTASSEERLERAEVLTLAPGNYVFRVTNSNVPYELGFWLREADYNWKNPVHQLTKLSVSGGGLTTGVTKDYEVELKPGEYLYSCPLNPTPDYRLIVSE